MTPLYFGTISRRLFGIYTPPQSVGTPARAAVLCQPWGQEYIRAHRSVRQLANMLCAAGYHVLRFDYYGAGDSAGESREVSLRGWSQDIETAIKELRDTAVVQRVTLVGLRLGGTLAAQVACRLKSVDSLVLWDPVVRGSEYLEELLSAVDLRDSETGRGLDGEASLQGRACDGSYPVSGFPLSPALMEDLRALDLAGQVSALPARTRIFWSAPLESHAALLAELTRQGRQDIVMENVDSVLAWRQYKDLGAGAVPAGMLEAQLRWLR